MKDSVSLGIWIYYTRVVRNSVDGKITQQFLEFEAGTDLDTVEEHLSRCGIDCSVYRERYAHLLPEVLKGAE